MKVQIMPSRQFTPSKHRNSSKQSLTFVDSAGKLIKGSPNSHFRDVYEKQQNRFNLKFEAFNLLTKEEIKELYLNGDKTKIKGSTDRAALEQVYYNHCFNDFKAQSKENLDLIKGNTYNNLNPVEKAALEDCLEFKQKEVEVTPEVKEETINSPEETN